MRVVLVALLLLGVAVAQDEYEVGVATVENPGRIPTEKLPMFILFTHDDAIKQSTFDAMTAVTDGRASRDGCPLVATMFVSSDVPTRCELAKDLYDRGYELADHTKSHLSLLAMSYDEIEAEILQGRDKLAECDGIPVEDIVGFRAPYLESKPEVREVLAANGFLYDSSLIETTRGSSISQHMAERVWPFDLKFGIPINCDWFRNTQKSDKTEMHDGLWEIPVWDLDALGEYTMDYGDDCGPGKTDCVFEILKANFDAAYNGNRAPMPLFIHTPWLMKKGFLEQTIKFVEYALEQDNVYFITMRQLIAWLKDPVPADELTPEILGCGTPGGKAPSEAAAPEGQQEWDWLDPATAESLAAAADEEAAAEDPSEEQAVAEREDPMSQIDELQSQADNPKGRKDKGGKKKKKKNKNA